MPFQALQTTLAEQKLIEAAQVGEVADFSTGNKESDDPQKGAEWGPERTVRAELVCALATGRGLPPQLSVTGVRLKGARVTHWLNFETARITDALVLVNCYIEDSIFLHGASMHSLVLLGSYVPNGISGNGLHVDRDLHLGQGFATNSEIVLLGASIRGNLALSGGSYNNPEGAAFSMDGIDVGRGLFLRDGFKAKGEVRLLGATVGGQLDCSRGEFQNANGVALNMDNIRVNGSVFLREGFHATGEVSLPDATIGGGLDCSEGKFENPAGRALTMDNINVKGDLKLGKGFAALGEVSLRHGNITGQADFSGGEFENQRAVALALDGSEAKGVILLREDFSAKGEVRLPRAVGETLDCSGGSFENAGGRPLNLENVKIADDVFLRNGFFSRGQVKLSGAIVGGTVDCSGGTFKNPNGDTLDMNRIDVKGSVFLRRGFAAEGKVLLVGSTVAGQLDCSAASFESANDIALNLDRTKVDRGIFFRDNFMAKGEVWLVGVEVAGQLECSGGKFENPNGPALTLQSATVKGGLFMRDGFQLNGALDLTHATADVLIDEEATWPYRGKLSLDGFTSGAIFETCDARKRLDWLARQPDFRPQPYEQLASVLRRMGHIRDAREILYAKNRKLRDVGGLGRLARFWDWLLEWTVGYGYKAHRTFGWAIGLFLAGFLVAYAGWGHGLMVRSQPKQNGVAYPSFHASLYSLEQFSLPPLSLGEKSYWRPSERHSHDLGYWSLQGYFIFQGLAGWILTGLLIAALTGIIKKE